MKSISINCRLFFGLPLLFGSFVASIAAQSSVLESDNPPSDTSGERFFYIITLIVVAALFCLIIFWWRSKQSDQGSQYAFTESLPERTSDIKRVRSVDSDKEMNGARNTLNPTARPAVRTSEVDRRQGQRRLSEIAEGSDDLNDLHLNPQAFREKMKRIQFSQLPINSLLKLTEARPFDQLPQSADPDLLDAVEQANEEFEEDEAVRELVVKILAAFRSQNAVAALSQIALYDLSSNIRSKAVVALTDFDHESVFEGILLACADPTREVRAAAARGLFRLSFDRAEAWKRLIATNDEFRMRDAARAAIESGIAKQSMDRLVHEDMRVAYEAFALVGLLIKSGETDDLMSAVCDHPDERVRKALLHVLKVIKDERSLIRLEDLIHENMIPDGLMDMALEAVQGIEIMAG